MKLSDLMMKDRQAEISVTWTMSTPHIDRT